MDSRTTNVRVACMAINDAAKKRQEQREQRRLRRLNSAGDGSSTLASPQGRSPASAAKAGRGAEKLQSSTILTTAVPSSSDTDSADDGEGPSLMAHKVTTYFPPTYTERTSLAEEWHRLEEKRREAAMEEAEADAAAQPLRYNSVGWQYPRRSPEPRHPTVTELLEHQKTMAYEADVVERMRQQAEREHIRLLGRTNDISGGRTADLLGRAKMLTASIDWAERAAAGGAPKVAGESVLARDDDVEDYYSAEPKDGGPMGGSGSIQRKRSNTRKGSFVSPRRVSRLPSIRRSGSMINMSRSGSVVALTPSGFETPSRGDSMVEPSSPTSKTAPGSPGSPTARNASLDSSPAFGEMHAET